MRDSAPLRKAAPEAEDIVPTATQAPLSSGLAIALLIASGLAPVLASPIEPAYDWSGWEIGANLGYGFGPSHIDIAPMSSGAVIRESFVSPRLEDRPSGAMGGLEAALARQSGAWVYGVVADWSPADVKDQVVGPFLQAPFDFRTTDSQRLDQLATLRAKLGFAPWDRALVYTTAGLALGRAHMSTFAIDTSADICGGTIKFCVGGSSEKWLAGFALGAGSEFALAANWSLKVEYLHYDLGKTTDTMSDILAPPDVFRGSASIRGDVVRLGLDYRFR